MTQTHAPGHFYEYPSGMIVCGECLDKDLADSRSGKLVEDERVYNGMFTRVKDDQTEAYQCDGCLFQNEAYEQLGEDE